MTSYHIQSVLLRLIKRGRKVQIKIKMSSKGSLIIVENYVLAHLVRKKSLNYNTFCAFLIYSCKRNLVKGSHFTYNIQYAFQDIMI